MWAFLTKILVVATFTIHIKTVCNIWELSMYKQYDPDYNMDRQLHVKSIDYEHHR